MSDDDLSDEELSFDDSIFLTAFIVPKQKVVIRSRSNEFD
jgi:hypothetical protein